MFEQVSMELQNVHSTDCLSHAIMIVCSVARKQSFIAKVMIMDAINKLLLAASEFTGFSTDKVYVYNQLFYVPDQREKSLVVQDQEFALCTYHLSYIFTNYLSFFLDQLSVLHVVMCSSGARVSTRFTPEQSFSDDKTSDWSCLGGRPCNFLFRMVSNWRVVLFTGL